MTRHVPIAEFKNRLSELVAAAEGGEEIVLTRHGKATAKITAISSDADDIARRDRAQAAFARMAEMRSTMRREGRTATIEEMIAWKNEGRP